MVKYLGMNNTFEIEKGLDNCQIKLNNNIVEDRNNISDYVFVFYVSTYKGSHQYERKHYLLKNCRFSFGNEKCFIARTINLEENLKELTPQKALEYERDFKLSCLLQ